MMNVSKRLLSMLLALAMVFSMVPVMALADGTDVSTETGVYETGTEAVTPVAETYVAKVGETSYETLQEAIDAISYSGTIVLDKSFAIDSETYTIPENKVITLNMNGKKLTVTDNRDASTCYELFYNYGTLIVDGNGTIELTSTSNDTVWAKSSTIFHNRGGQLTIQSGTFKHLGGTCMAFVVDNSGNYYGDATANINGGTLTSTYTAIRNRMEQNSHGASGKATVNVSGVGTTITGTTSAIWAQAASISETSPATGAINISGGNVGVVNTARSSGAECMTTISGGTVEAVKCEVGELTVNGGTITGTVTILTADGAAADYTITDDGLYAEVPAAPAVLPEAAVAELGSTVITDYDVYNGKSLVDGDGTPLGMQIAMQFTAQDSAEEAANSYYGDYTTDFFITIDGLANGSVVADGCYLVGHYGDFGWVKVPLDGMTIENGVYPVISSTGLDFSYEEICTSVKEFKCGIFFSEEVLEANPGLTVGLELGLAENLEKAQNAEFTPVQEEPYTYTAEELKAGTPVLPEATVENLGKITVGEGDYADVDSYYEYDLLGNQTLTTKEGSFDLQMAMQFIAKDDAESAAANAYGEYTTDFYITIEGMEGDSFVGDGCYLAGYYPSFEEWVVIPLDGFTVENGKAYPVISSAGFDFSYVDICTTVENFICGIYLSEDVLEANPNLTVGLDLGLSETFEDAQAAKFITVDEYTYTAEDLKSEPAVAEVDGTKYATLQEAIDAADGKTVTLLTDIALAEGITVAAGKTVTLELNGYTVSRNTEAAVSSAAITNNGSLTIQDSVGGGKVTAFAANPDTAAIPYYASNTITNYGVLTLKSGTIENSTGNDARAAYPIDNNSTSRDTIVNIEGGTVIGRGAIRAFANSTTYKNEVNISDGTVSGTSYAVWVQNPSDGSTANTKEVKAALNVTGGTVDKLLLEPSENITASVTGGTVKEIAIWDEDTVNTERNPSGFVTGGTFLSDVTEFCAEGYTCEDNGDGTYGIEEVELWNLAGTTVNLGTSLGIRFFFAKANFEEGTDYYAMITKEYANRDDVVETIPMANWETSGAYYTTLFNDIPAKEMTDNVTIQIFKADGTAVSNPATESIQSYATRMLNNPNQAQKAKIAVVDMLNYGAAAQNEFGYNTENLANALLTDEQASWATESATYEIAAEGDRVYGVGSMIALESNVYLRLVFANVDTETMYGIVTYNDYKDRPQTVRIEGSDFKSVGSNYYAADVLTMVVADARQQVTCTLYNANGEAIGYAIDSIESNLARGVNNGTISIVMAEGLLKFADSAKAYLTNS